MKHLLLLILTFVIFQSVSAQSTIKIDTAGRSNKQQAYTQLNANSFDLKQNFPNPFNKTTRIEFSVPDSRMVEFKVYDMLGQTVSSKLINCQSGINYIILERENMQQGFYFYSIQSGSSILTKRLMVRD